MAKARWEPLLIKNLKLVIPEHYMFMASKNFFIAFGILGNEYKLQINSTPNSTSLSHSYLDFKLLDEKSKVIIPKEILSPTIK